MEIIIPQTNLNLQHDKHWPTTYGEFLHWMGLWFLIATINGPDHCDFWSLGEVDCFVGAAMRLYSFMSRKCFKAMLKALAITARQPPAFRDHFWEVREVLEAWNSNMMEQFTPHPADGRWSLWKGRILHWKSSPNSTFKGKQLDHCFMSWSPYLEGA